MSTNTNTNTNNIPNTLVTEDVTEFIFLLIESMNPNMSIGSNPIATIECIIDAYTLKVWGVVGEQFRSMVTGDVAMASDIHRLTYDRQVYTP